MIGVGIEDWGSVNKEPKRNKGLWMMKSSRKNWEMMRSMMSLMPSLGIGSSSQGLWTIWPIEPGKWGYSIRIKTDKSVSNRSAMRLCFGLRKLSELGVKISSKSTILKKKRNPLKENKPFRHTGCHVSTSSHFLRYWKLELGTKTLSTHYTS